MSLGCALTVLVGMALQLPAGAAIAAAPAPLSPANGARFIDGQDITFRIRSNPGEFADLWLHVSRSPRKVYDCGAIGLDIDVDFPSATSDPRVYALTVSTVDGFQNINGTGTFYWQAARYPDPDNVDECVPGPVRRFVVSKPNRLPGLYRGTTTQGRGLSFRLATTRTKITHLDTSISLSCSRGRLRTRLAFGDITVATDGSFAQTLRSSNFTITGSQTATLRGRFRSPTRATGTVSSSASFPFSVGRCGRHRYAWTARRSGA